MLRVCRYRFCHRGEDGQPATFTPRRGDHHYCCRYCRQAAYKRRAGVRPRAWNGITGAKP